MRDYPQTEPGDCDVFRSLAPSTRKRILPLCISRSFDKNEIIFLKGDPGDGLYLIRLGRIKISAVDRQGTELIFTFLSRGDILGEIALLDGKPRSASATAVEKTETLYLSRDDFMKFLQTSPRACIGIIDMLCGRLRRISVQLEELSFLDVSGRLARHLTAMKRGSPHDTKTYTCSTSQEELADIIGASRVMVNKVLQSFVELGFVSIARKRLTILNAHELNRIASYDGDS
jgi:CRP/FNR family cyclic AMP-dependent transcriptional regulator